MLTQSLSLKCAYTDGRGKALLMKQKKKNILGNVLLLFIPCLNPNTLAAYFYSIDYFSVCHIEYLIIYFYGVRKRETNLSKETWAYTSYLGYTALSWPNSYLARNKGREQKNSPSNENTNNLNLFAFFHPGLSTLEGLN